ncbi:MAG: ABC transporter ATP-binding protein [Phycisphaerales bacterium]|nr:ABC transporter ATP-binding protein [Phycisphaerales bacterium]
MASVGLRNVVKEFGGKRNRVVAVDGLTLDVADRELMVLLGPSGCGKTTTLRMVAGLEAPTRGEIEIGGRPVNDVSPKDRDVAMVFQHFALYPHLNVGENLAFGLKMRKTPKAEIAQRVGEVAAMLEIEGLLERRPHELSSGQQQRVALGRAIVRRPRVYLFDEPLANLDPRLRSVMRVELKRRHRGLGMTALYVTHDQDEAMALGDRVAVMKDGRLQQVGRPQDVYERPANRFVAGFVGEPAMNFIGGTLAGGAGGLRFVSADGQVGLGAEWANPGDVRVGERVVLGIRPEAVGLTATAEPGETGFIGAVTLVVRLGDRTDVHTRTGGGVEVVVRVTGGCDWREGDRVALSVDRARVLLFEASDEGARLMFGGRGVGSHAA